MSNLALALPTDRAVTTLLIHCAEILQQAFLTHRKSGWVWFEPALSYDNARLPEALIRAGMALSDRHLIASGIEALSWLAPLQITPAGHFRPVGNETFGRDYVLPAAYDQQPIEAAAMIDACWAAFDASGDTGWEDEAHRAYGWFFGRNTNGVPLAAANGGCYDGLQRDGVNRNQGAESILALQLANCAMKTRERGRSIPPVR